MPKDKIVAEKETVGVKDTPLESRPQWKTSFYWQKLFLYFYFFSLFGHYLELGWSFLCHNILGAYKFVPVMFFQVPLAPPYGLGVVAIMLIVLPLKKKFKMNPFLVFLLSALVMGAVEYISGMSLVLAFGANDFWSYEGQIANFQGQVCLRNCLMFGVGSLAFVYWLMPWCEKLLAKFKQKTIKKFFWFIFVCFMLDFGYSISQYGQDAIEGRDGWWWMTERRLLRKD